MNSSRNRAITLEKQFERALELELVFSRVSSGRHLQHHFQQHGKAYPPGRDLWWLPVFLNYLIPPFLFLVGKPMLRAWKPPSRLYTCVTQNLLLFWTDWPNLSPNVPLDSISLKFIHQHSSEWLQNRPYLVAYNLLYGSLWMTQNLGFSRFYRGPAQVIYVFIYCSTPAPGDFLGRSTFPSSPLQYQRRGGGARRFWWIKSLMTYKFVQFIKQCIRIDYNYSNFKRYVFIHLITSSLLVDDSERLLLNMK